MRVHADSDGVWGASISVEYDPALLRVIGYERCPEAPGNEFGGLGVCGVSGGTLPVAFGHVPVIDDTLGQSGTFAAECGHGCGAFDSTFELVHVSFEVIDPPGLEAPVATAVTHFYEPGVSGLGSNAGPPGEVSFPDVPPAPLLVLPPPEVPALPTAALGWLGAGLAVAARVFGARAPRPT